MRRTTTDVAAQNGGESSSALAPTRSAAPPSGRSSRSLDDLCNDWAMPQINPSTTKRICIEDTGRFQRQTAEGEGWAISRVFPSSSAVDKPTTSAKETAKAKTKTSTPVHHEQKEITAVDYDDDITDVSLDPDDDDDITDVSLDPDYAYLLDDFPVPWPSNEKRRNDKVAEEGDGEKNKDVGKGKAKETGRVYGKEKKKEKQKEKGKQREMQKGDLKGKGREERQEKAKGKQVAVRQECEDDDIPVLISPAVRAERKGKQPEKKPRFEQSEKVLGDSHFIRSGRARHTEEEKQEMTPEERALADEEDAFYDMCIRAEKRFDRDAMLHYERQAESSRMALAGRRATTSK
ncbi:hypothetical protein P389DRAFT_39884 [Cystobasidium minutum MCA 4210]|uniref:uncharacterized protein n=1 Tax=Cystobasidium minutum MCA 4210 TaxID=1397322 RepID=UPI0034CE48A6|eukprot:jgi/Rhomi1/39884/CE39883_54